MSHLSELGMLNLAGNGISRVENLQGLESLTELNLRHNCISDVVRFQLMVDLSVFVVSAILFLQKSTSCFLVFFLCGTFNFSCLHRYESTNSSGFAH